MNSETDFVSKNDSFIAWPMPRRSWIASTTLPTFAALGTLAYEQDGFGPRWKTCAGA